VNQPAASDPGPPLEVRVWGELACFTRPEFKVERVSYPMMTPSAARGVLDAIFWKPEFTWEVVEIWMLRKVAWASFVRNEVKSVAAVREIQKWAVTGVGSYVASSDRDQRHTLALRDVAYVVRARQLLRDGVTHHPAKYRDQFRRRVAHGQCFTRPFLGCREFAAEFGPVDPQDHPQPHDEDLGRMLWGLDYRFGIRGRGQPVFFDARLAGGVLHVPPRSSVLPAGVR
jgi:CRISPR-associated protein Cas5d